MTSFYCESQQAPAVRWRHCVCVSHDPVFLLRHAVWIHFPYTCLGKLLTAAHVFALMPCRFTWAFSKLMLWLNYRLLLFEDAMQCSFYYIVPVKDIPVHFFFTWLERECFSWLVWFLCVILLIFFSAPNTFQWITKTCFHCLDERECKPAHRLSIKVYSSVVEETRALFWLMLFCHVITM